MSQLPTSYKAAVIVKGGEPLVVKEVPLKKPGRNEVLVKVIACGVCHTDLFIASGGFGDFFPRVTGHEIVGDVVAVGEDVTKYSNGDRVGGAWHGGHDGTCRSCSRGQFQMCENEKFNGVHFDGGFAEYVILRAEAVSRVPKELDPAQAAPLLCAGVTTFNAIRKHHVEQGNLVAIQGLGGLGHLAVQYASKMGYRVAAISSGSAKRDFAFELGAHEYIDTTVDDPVKKLQELGGAAMIVSTAPNPKAISPLVGGLQPRGKLIMLAPVGGVEFDTAALVMKGCSVEGWLSGNALDSEEAIQFAQTHGVKCLVEKFPLADVGKAMEACATGKVRFRAVLMM
ncbi:alcohol dehydrogenase [Xylaria intraflava]|nr:alcohol dehydrogenase [Xylaria intraflava]